MLLLRGGFPNGDLQPSHDELLFDVEGGEGDARSASAVISKLVEGAAAAPAAPLAVKARINEQWVFCGSVRSRPIWSGVFWSGSFCCSDGASAGAGVSMGDP